MEAISENLAIDLSVKVANTRTVWLHTMRLMLNRGLVTEADLDSMRDGCMDAAIGFVSGSSGLRRELGVAGIRDMDALFRKVVR